MKTGEIAHET